MSPKITAQHELTKRSTFAAVPFRAVLLLEPRMRPQVTVARSTNGQVISTLIKEVLDLSEIEVLIEILGAIAEELRPTEASSDEASE
ncbi:hypothetical protein [Arthrobacter sp. StoSoilB22]|uniref:hypothetical protein n=1 Tax=Arthrobacter sp. StoSoilB22 TaxID=2830996 RepID=UPI001CC5C3C0|nr:hypothetical protein [Arthrobacter sp. StoSoilB22]BCW61878.1 hypothetical protein StoSoilB22_08510 [Arthrobacter sp. StoSoilB22]